MLADLRKQYRPLSGFTETQILQQCLACHQNENIAPEITSIVGRKVASTAYPYSPAMQLFSENNPIWTEDLLVEFLTSPQKTIPGTTMSYRGLDNVGAARLLVEHLKLPQLTGAN